MVNARLSVSVVWTSLSNRMALFGDWACLLLSSSLWQEESLWAASLETEAGNCSCLHEQLVTASSHLLHLQQPSQQSLFTPLSVIWDTSLHTLFSGTFQHTAENCNHFMTILRIFTCDQSAFSLLVCLIGGTAFGFSCGLKTTTFESSGSCLHPWPQGLFAPFAQQHRCKD